MRQKLAIPRTRGDEPATTGQRIRAARVAAGLTQAQLSTRLGCQQSRISEIECGRWEPHARLMREIGKSLGCDFRDLFGE